MSAILASVSWFFGSLNLSRQVQAVPFSLNFNKEEYDIYVAIQKGFQNIVKGVQNMLKEQRVSSQKLGAEKTDHSDESRPEGPSFPDEKRSQTPFPQNIEKILLRKVVY